MYYSTILFSKSTSSQKIRWIPKKNPPIIFLDEPTASLDAIATEQIKLSLDAIKKDRTVIIISHSISQIIDADHVIVLEKGSVMEQGTHEHLYGNKGTYFDIFNAMANSLNIEKIAKTLDDDALDESIEIKT